MKPINKLFAQLMGMLALQNELPRDSNPTPYGPVGRAAYRWSSRKWRQPTDLQRDQKLASPTGTGPRPEHRPQALVGIRKMQRWQRRYPARVKAETN